MEQNVTFVGELTLRHKETRAIIMNHMKAEHSRVPSVISMIEACKNKKKRELAKKSERDSKKVRNQRTQPRITAFAKSRGVMDAFKEKL